MKPMKTPQQKREQIRQECAKRGLKINPYGNGFWIEGAGVSLIVSDLQYLSGKELDPAYEVARR